VKSFKPIEDGDGPPPPDPGGRRNPEADFRGQKRSNQTHRGTTDPEARLYRKGSGMEAKLAYIGHALMENRAGLGLRPGRRRLQPRAHPQAHRPDRMTPSQRLSLRKR
jgi:hypothetical protein